jgi:hypothetical protein
VCVSSSPTTTCYCGKGLLELVRVEKPELVIVDIRMPPTGTTDRGHRRKARAQHHDDRANASVIVGGVDDPVKGAQEADSSAGPNRASVRRLAFVTISEASGRASCRFGDFRRPTAKA